MTEWIWAESVTSGVLVMNLWPTPCDLCLGGINTMINYFIKTNIYFVPPKRMKKMILTVHIRLESTVNSIDKASASAKCPMTAENCLVYV